MARRTRTRRTGARTRRPRTGKKSRGKLRRKRTRRPRISKRFFMRGGGGTLIINLSQKNAIINSGLKDASGKNIVVTIPPNNFHATIPTGDNPNYNMKINDKEIKFNVGDSERNIVIIDATGNIKAEKDNDSQKYTIEKLKNGDFPDSNGPLDQFYIKTV
jgi:hypothetical protein